jgi:hypothetical protein
MVERPLNALIIRLGDDGRSLCAMLGSPLNALIIVADSAVFRLDLI